MRVSYLPYLLTTLGLGISRYVASFVFPYHDFVNFWAAPHLALQDISLLFELDRYREAQVVMLGLCRSVNLWSYPPSLWSYPPHLLPLLLPLGLIPVILSQVLWCIVGFFAYAYAGYRGFVAEYRPIGILLLLISPAALTNLGQNAFFTSALFLGALACLDKRPIVAGILLGLLTIKPQLGLVWPLALLALGCWRTIAAAVVTTMLLILLSIGIYGIEVWEGFFGFTMPRQWEFIVAPYHPFAYQLLLLSFPNAAQSAGLPVSIGLQVQWIVSAFVIIGCAVGMRRTHDFQVRALLMCSGAMLCSPYIMNYDLVMLSAVLLWALLTPGTMLRPITALYALMYLLPMLSPFFNLLNFPISPLLLLLLYLHALRQALHHGDHSPRPHTSTHP